MSGAWPAGDRPGDGNDGWSSAGFDAAQADAFRRYDISLADAVAWSRAGVTDGLEAARWRMARVTPKAVAGWRAAGISADEAVHWHEIGYGLRAATEAKRRALTPAEASRYQQEAGARAIAHPRTAHPGRSSPVERFVDAGVPAAIIKGYADRDWLDATALEWARRGVPAGDVAIWTTLGVTPAEAGRLVGAGTGPVDVVRDWWHAGIPLDEVAEWLGAGFTPQEAMEQRADGVTAEQAALLRALRDDEDT